jgi:hypothetical protein
MRKKEKLKFKIIFFKKVLIIFLFFFLLVSFTNASDMTGTNFIIRDPSMGTTGDYSSSGNFKMNNSGDTIFTDIASSTNFQSHFGFLYYPYVNPGTLTATLVGSQVNLSWPASTAGQGWNVSGYKTGSATVSGGPYTYTSVGNVTSYSYTSLAPGDYYYVIQTLDGFGSVIATSNEVHVTVSTTLTFDLDTYATSTTNTKTSAPYSVSLGNLSTTQASNSDESYINAIWFDLSANTPGGTIVSVSSANGALKSISKPTDSIPSATGTMAPSVANYGLCDKRNDVVSGTFNKVSPFNGATCTTGHVNTVGAVTTGTQTIYNSGGAPITSARAEIMVNAENSVTTPAHTDYSDTLDFIATSTF